MKSAHDMPFGASLTPAGAKFAIWAPSVSSAQLVVDGRRVPMQRGERGFFHCLDATAAPGSRYAFCFDGGDLVVPDPASRFNPDGVHEPSELDGALDLAFRHDTLALVETYVPGARDLEVAIIGDARGALELFGPGEIVSGHEFYDYAAKYTAGLSETSTRAEVSDRERATMLKIARDAYRAALRVPLSPLMAFSITTDAERLAGLQRALLTRAANYTQPPPELVAERIRRTLAGRPRLATDDAGQALLGSWVTLTRPHVLAEAPEVLATLRARLANFGRAQ
jgi:hypothetical protein